MKQSNIIIRLKSDLCVASGEGFSSGIDVDVCSDGHGLPVIPGRRLKGCLREAARFIGVSSEDCDKLFGVPGANEPGNVTVSNATLLHYEGLEDACKGADPKRVLARFTSVRAQTKLEDGVAEDNTLRFTRVVNRIISKDSSSLCVGLSNAEGNELEFRAVVEYRDKDDGDLLAVVCKALRAIGLGRNRGLGAVTCRLIHDSQLQNERANKDVTALMPNGVSDDEVCSVDYVVKLLDPIMLVQQNGDESTDYVPGSSVLGFFASRLASHSEFENLFLKDRVRFSNLYPMHDGKRTYPAFGIIAKVKGGDKDGSLTTMLTEVPGSSLKPLKAGFVDASTFAPVSTPMEIVYHHSTGNGRDDAESELYTQRCLSAGQELSGRIEGPAWLIRPLLDVMGERFLRFGRSKSAQYSRCELMVDKTSISVVGDVEGDVKVWDGACVWLLDSDVLLINERTACWSPTYEDLAAALGVGKNEIDEVHTYLRFKTVSGYNAKWNQKKPHVRALAAGSCLAFRATGYRSPSVRWVGARNGEGFGRLILMRADGIALAASHQECTTYEESGEEQVRMKAIEDVRALRGSFGEGRVFNSSFIGRLALMLDDAKSSSQEKAACIADFYARVKSVKKESKREAVLSALPAENAFTGDMLTFWYEYLDTFLTMGKYLAKQAKGDRS